MGVDFYIDVILRVGMIFSWLFTGIILIITKTKQKIKTNQIEKLIDKTEKNKNNQIEKEKQIEMGKTLCDRCNAEIAVREVMQFGNLDLCAACYKDFASRQTILEDLQKEIDETYTKLLELKKRFSDNSTEIEIALKASRQEQEPCKTESSTNTQEEDNKAQNENIDVVERMFKGVDHA